MSNKHKQTYCSPQLVEHGTIAGLTHQVVGSGGISTTAAPTTSGPILPL